MLRQIERVVQKEPITNNEVLPVTTLVFLKILKVFCLFVVPTTQMYIFILLVSS